MEDVWRGEAQDLLTQIAQLQEENKSLLTNLSIKDPMSEEDLQRHEGEEDARSQLSQTMKSMGHNFKILIKSDSSFVSNSRDITDAEGNIL